MLDLLCRHEVGGRGIISALIPSHSAKFPLDHSSCQGPRGGSAGPHTPAEITLFNNGRLAGLSIRALLRTPGSRLLCEQTVGASSTWPRPLFVWRLEMPRCPWGRKGVASTHRFQVGQSGGESLISSTST